MGRNKPGGRVLADADGRCEPVRLGVDGSGRLHVYQPDRDRVTVLDARGIDHVERLDGRSVREWQAYVGTVRGWRRRDVTYVSARDLFGDAE